MSVTSDYFRLVGAFYARIGLPYTQPQDGVHALSIDSRQLLLIGLDEAQAALVAQADLGTPPEAALRPLLGANHPGQSGEGAVACLTPEGHAALVLRLPLEGLAPEALEQRLDALVRRGEAWLLMFAQMGPATAPLQQPSGDAFNPALRA